MVGGNDRQMCIRGISRLDPDTHFEQISALGAQEAFMEMDTAWSQPFAVNQPANFYIKLGTPLAYLEQKRQLRPHRLRVVCGRTGAVW